MPTLLYGVSVSDRTAGIQMRYVAFFLALGLLVLLQFLVSALVSYFLGPLAFVLLSLALGGWVGWVLVDCWYLSRLDEQALAPVQWFLAGSVFVSLILRPFVCRTSSF